MPSVLNPLPAAVTSVFKLQEFDLEPVLAEWKNPPRFEGEPKKDLPIDDWLQAVQEGCEARSVPRDYWPRVGQRFLGPRAHQRFEELKAVLRQMHGGRYRFDWKRFKVAMRNMCWEIADDKTVNVQRKSTGIWSILGGSKSDDSPPPYTEEPKPLEVEQKKRVSDEKDKMALPPKKKRQGTLDEKAKLAAATQEDCADAPTGRPSAPRRMTSWLSRRSSCSNANVDLTEDPVMIEYLPAPTRSWQSSPLSTSASTPASTPAGTPAQTPGEVLPVNAAAPLWLLNACGALEFLHSEHPKTMSTVAAVLITVGSLPALPGLSAVAGGTVLASHAVQAAGAVAVGIGNWLRTSQTNVAHRQREAEEHERIAQIIERAPSGGQR